MSKLCKTTRLLNDRGYAIKIIIFNERRATLFQFVLGLEGEDCLIHVLFMFNILVLL